MAMPKSVVKTQKNRKTGQIEYTFVDNVDRVNYTLKELCKAALRDSGKLLTKRVKEATPVKTGTLKKAWDKKVVKDKSTGEYMLIVGTRKKKAATDKKPYAPHAHLVLFGHKTVNGKTIPGNNFFEKITHQSIEDMRSIQSQYLSAIEDEFKAQEIIADNDKEEEEEI